MTMIIQTIELENFKSYGESQTVDLTGVDATSISGLNGAGKSTLIEAITFALYGRSTATERKELGNEAIIRDGQKEGRVAVSFEKDDQTYRVERTATRQGQGTATLISGTAKALQAGTSNVTKMVESILGMDYETFVSSTIMRQDEMDRITSLRPGERKEVLSKIFGLEEYEKLKKATHERLIKARADVEASDQLTRKFTEAIASEDEVRQGITNAKANAKKYQAAIETEQASLHALEKDIKAALENKSAYDTATANLESLEGEIEDIQSDIGESAEEIREAKDAKSQLSELAKEIEKGKALASENDKLQKQKEQLTSTITEKEARARAIQETIEQEKTHYSTIQSSKKAECPVCKRPLDVEHKTQVLKQYDARLKKLQAEQGDFSSEASGSRKKLQEILPRMKELEEETEAIRKLTLAKAKLEATASRLPKLFEHEKGLKESLEKAVKGKEAVKTKLLKLKSAAEEYEKLDKKRNALSEKLAELREQRVEAETTLKHLAEQIELINKAKAELKVLKENIATKTAAIPIYTILEEAFGKDGIPTAILRDLVPEVEDEASKLLRELSNGRMAIDFRFGRTTGRGTQTDELIIEAEDGTGKHPVTRYSGGERMRINLALRLGISEVIAIRSGYKGKIETLIIDEGLGALDEEGRQATIEILRQLRQRFRKILVISHVEDVKEAFETKLVISKDTKGQSVVEMV
jgi:exonuclease SbcC